ncbi:MULTISPECIES: hypothetical protein [Vibrio]|uniref:Uncharacterized protein n=1 Tax=Vibrio vulnificus TaxID=672 RepID=A0A2S3R1G5_VIBVL|nr:MULTISPECIES: hypothetical protein [Vibrio]MCZ2798834.1 hypothetical protein [Vibrio alginolyticus]POB46951.1 hypothetical protein CRN52_12805 [Vibrio vulnificus]
MKLFGRELNKLTAKNNFIIGTTVLACLLFYIPLGVVLGFSGKLIFELACAVGIGATLSQLGIPVEPKFIPLYVICAAIAAGFGNFLYYLTSLIFS